MHIEINQIIILDERNFGILKNVNVLVKLMLKRQLLGKTVLLFCFRNYRMNVKSFRCLAFEPTNASYMLTGSNDMLRVYNWEPVQLLDTVQMGWKNVIDMTIHRDQLVCLQNFITIH